MNQIEKEMRMQQEQSHFEKTPSLGGNLVTPLSHSTSNQILLTGRTGGPGTITAGSNLSYSASSAGSEDSDAVARRFMHLSHGQEDTRSELDMPLKIESKEHLWKPAPIVGRDFAASQGPVPSSNQFNYASHPIQQNHMPV